MKLDLSSAGESPSCLSAAEAEAAPEAERPGSFSAPSPLAAATELSLEEGGGSGLPICEQVWASNAKGLFLASSCGRQRQGEGEGGETRDPWSGRGGADLVGPAFCTEGILNHSHFLSFSHMFQGISVQSTE